MPIIKLFAHNLGRYSNLDGRVAGSYMTGNEFLDRVKRYARRHDVAILFDPGHGKGSHGRLYLGSRETVVKDRRKEIGIGLLSKMCSDLGITVKDLYDH